VSTNPQIQIPPSQLQSSITQQWRQYVTPQLNELRVAVPAFLVSDMDAATQTATVQIAIQERVATPQGAKWWDLPPIQLVPIVLPRGGGFAQTLPLKKGDEGLLVFCDGCFDLWWTHGTQNAPPADNTKSPSGSQRNLGCHHHEFWDCGFIPGMTSKPNVISDYKTDAAELRTLDGSVRVSVKSDRLQLTAPDIEASNGGTAQVLVTDAFYQWYVDNVLPFLKSKGYAGPDPPSTSETSIFKAE
jgi:hypothetical protein